MTVRRVKRRQTLHPFAEFTSTLLLSGIIQLSTRSHRLGRSLSEFSCQDLACCKRDLHWIVPTSYRRQTGPKLRMAEKFGRQNGWRAQWGVPKWPADGRANGWTAHFVLVRPFSGSFGALLGPAGHFADHFFGHFSFGPVSHL